MGINYNARHIEKSDLDYFPTPPWATRALLTHTLKLRGAEVREPCAGGGHMAKVLEEFNNTVIATDIEDYGYCPGGVDYLNTPMDKTEWMVTNPPFNRAQEVIEKALSETTVGVAILIRSAFTESVKRYNTLYSVNPPSIIAQYTERVAMCWGRYDHKAGSYIPYSWLIWLHDHEGPTEFKWIPPSKAALFKDSDIEPQE